ncbi:PLD nuclease N-terminal domain-containing protein [Virgibacillus siamensis]|uniref:PLD nuclease N-terminal domain-containing protein n=1 Tax=Virgibacillus siamensis TaxID=480071 RepID=UPI0011157DD9|nr:PLD nuclease N-terminal domain-containing protein [Virgibacillus siamensis]
MNLLSEINWAVIAPILIIQFILFIVALVDVIRIERTNGPKWMWVLIILFINIIGPIVYFIFGRRQQ